MVPENFTDLSPEEQAALAEAAGYSVSDLEAARDFLAEQYLR